jgi:tRNA-2-methylthio-N6-dimethylallyladenosine synthase
VKRLFYIATMGCQMNENDSDTLAQHLINYGLDRTDNQDSADLIMINTCTVREKARQKAFSLLGRMALLKKKRPDTILGIMGCIAQQEGATLLKRHPSLDLVLGTREVGNISRLLDRIEKNGERLVATDLSAEHAIPDIPDGYFNDRLKAYIPIMEGCNNFCTYCIVPFVRGREKSSSSKDILELAEQLTSQGIKEITLVGQNVNSYFSPEGRGISFADLLKTLSEVEGLVRIRFTTSHPKDLSGELIECFSSLHNLCPHIHLPFQSGSDRILKLMKRGYTVNKYIRLIEALRDIRPDIAITSDVIVGFPGESEDDFNMTLDLIEKIEFDNLFSFKYSDRQGTFAATMSEKISEDIKLYRLSILQEKQKTITLKKNRMLEGREVEILIDGFSKRGGQLSGRTPCNKIVNITSSNSNMIGTLVKVEINKSYVNSLQGVLIN